MTDLIRPHDPFSGHEEPSAAEDATEPAKLPEPPAPPQEPAKTPVRRKTAAKTPVRRGRRPRRVPTDAEVAEAAKKVKP